MGLKNSTRTFVFLHGFCESSALWDNITGNLPDSQEYLTPDLPGFGNRDLPEGMSGLRDVAEKIITELPENRSYTLIGHSLGGYVALEILKSGKRNIESLCLFHSTAKADNEEKKKNRDRSIDFLETYGKEPFLKQFVPSLFYSENLETQFGNFDKMKRIASQSRLEAIISYTAWMRDRADHVSALGKAEIPVLYIAGEHDSFLPKSSLEEEVKSINNAELKVFQGVGHLGMIEKPGAAISILNEFLFVGN